MSESMYEKKTQRSSAAISERVFSPLTLRFKDADLERRYTHHYYETNAAFFRLLYILCILTTVGIGWVEYLLFSSKTFQQLFLIRYGLVLPLVLSGGFLVLAERFHELRRNHHQVILSLLFFAGLSPCFLMGLEIIKENDSQHILYGGLVMMLGFLFVFFLSRMWFLYAALFSGVFLLVAASLAYSHTQPTLFGLGSFVFYTLGGYLICLFGSYYTERHVRSHFLSMELLAGERQKSEQLLLNILPSEFAERLKRKEQYIAESYEEVSVLFADIVGFTPLSEKLEATRLVELLNQIFSDFDEICESLGVEKIKTIGDAYMAATGVPTPQQDHAERIARAALQIRATVDQFNEQMPETDLAIRVGIHSGAVVAGVIGRKKFIYDLWGDTVNLASRMESHGESGKIQLTEETAALLEDSFVLAPRGEIELKGKEPRNTYWLLSEKPDLVPTSAK